MFSIPEQLNSEKLQKIEQFTNTNDKERHLNTTQNVSKFGGNADQNIFDPANDVGATGKQGGVKSQDSNLSKNLSKGAVSDLTTV